MSEIIEMWGKPIANNQKNHIKEQKVQEECELKIFRQNKNKNFSEIIIKSEKEVGKNKKSKGE